MKNWKTSLFGFLNVLCGIAPLVYPPAAPVALALVPFFTGLGHVVAADAKCDGTGGCKKSLGNLAVGLVVFLSLLFWTCRTSAASFYSQRARTPLQVFVIPGGNPNTDLYATNGAVGSMAMVADATNAVLWIKNSTNGYVIIGTGSVVSNEVTVTNVVVVSTTYTNTSFTNLSLWGTTSFKSPSLTNTATAGLLRFNVVACDNVADSDLATILTTGGGTVLAAAQWSWIDDADFLAGLTTGDLAVGGTLDVTNDVTFHGSLLQALNAELSVEVLHVVNEALVTTLYVTNEFNVPPGAHAFIDSVECGGDADFSGTFLCERPATFSQDVLIEGTNYVSQGQQMTSDLYMAGNHIYGIYPCVPVVSIATGVGVLAGLGVTVTTNGFPSCP